jgi:hypothetical protein
MKLIVLYLQNLGQLYEKSQKINTEVWELDIITVYFWMDHIYTSAVVFTSGNCQFTFRLFNAFRLANSREA